jgi:hypothetical protein
LVDIAELDAAIAVDQRGDAGRVDVDREEVIEQTATVSPCRSSQSVSI